MAKKNLPPLPRFLYGQWDDSDAAPDETFVKTSEDAAFIIDSAAPNVSARVGVYELTGYATVARSTSIALEPAKPARSRKRK